MGLLDSDAEELKKNRTENSTGRPVNKSGLGALRKYADLTAKYRQTGNDPAPVEQSRGTPAKSEQSQGAQPAGGNVEVGAKSVQLDEVKNSTSSPAVEHARGTSEKSEQSQGASQDLSILEVGAKSGQGDAVRSLPQSSEDAKVGAKSEHTSAPESAPQHEESRGKVGAEFTHFEIKKDLPDTTEESNKVGTKSEQVSVTASDYVAQGSSKIVSNESRSSLDFQVSEQTPKSGQSQSTKRSPAVSIQLEAHKVGAKSGHEFSIEKEASGSELGLTKVSAKSDQAVFADESKVGAKSGQLSTENTHGEQSKDLDSNMLKSEQSRSKVRAYHSRSVAEQFNKVGAKSGQEKVSIEDHQKTLPPDAEIKVGAKSDQKASGGASKVGAKSGQVVLGEVGRRFASNMSVPVDGLLGQLKEQKIQRTGLNPQDKRVVPESNDPVDVATVSGSQRVILDYMFDLCIWANSLVTPPIVIGQLAKSTGINEGTAISSIKRMCKKGVISRDTYKDGKGGWTKYKLNETVYKDLVHQRQMVLSGKMPQAPHLLSSVASEPEKPPLSWFNDLDFSSVHPISPSLVNSKIKKAVQEKLTPEQVQDFISRYTSWFVTQAQDQIGSPVGLFCRKLQEFAVNDGASPILSFMTKEELAVEAEFLANAEKTRLEMELVRKAKEQQRERESEEKFEAWFASASEQEKRAVYAPTAHAPIDSQVYKAALRETYKQTFGAV
nr:hypothetical protein BdHM001_35470 [Bdellovibrio sp. HM001]